MCLFGFKGTDFITFIWLTSRFLLLLTKNKHAHNTNTTNSDKYNRLSGRKLKIHTESNVMVVMDAFILFTLSRPFKQSPHNVVFIFIY